MNLLQLLIASAIASSDCQPTISGSCSFYDCAENLKQCGKDQYLTKVGLKYCNLMIQSLPLFSPASKVVVAELLKCQQNAISPPINNKDATCDDIEDYGYDAMVPCFSRHGAFSNYSLCDFPLDWAQWLKLVKQEEPVDEDYLSGLRKIGSYCGLNVLREVWVNFGMDD